MTEENDKFVDVFKYLFRTVSFHEIGREVLNDISRVYKISCAGLAFQRPVKKEVFYFFDFFSSFYQGGPIST